MTEQPTTLSVRGTASLEVLADHALVTVQVRRADPDRGLATSAAAEAADAVRAAVAAADGVRRSAISRVRVTEVWQWDEPTRTNVRSGWEAALGGTVDVAAEHAGAAVTALVDAGAEVPGLDWRADDDNPGYREVRRQALSAAQLAAADFAAALGGRVGDLLELADAGLLSDGGDRQPARRMALVAMTSGAVEVDPQVLTLRAVVEARYVLASADGG